jgi:hypothetical protein
VASTDGAVKHAPDDRVVPVRKIAGYCLAIVSVATAVIHFAVSGEHFQEYWLFGVFMLTVAWLQLLWAVAIVTRPVPWVLAGGAVVNAGIIVIYIVTRTVGDVIGPTPHDVEPFGFGDGLCTVLEALIVAGCCWLLVSKADRLVPRDQMYGVPASLGGAIVVLLSLALVAGGPEMVMTAPPAPAAPAATSGGSVTSAGSGMQMSGGTATGVAAVSLATTTPAGRITMPDPNMQMMTGMRMASSRTCDSAPTHQQQAAAVSLVDTSWRDLQKFRSLAAAKAAGYMPITPTGAAVVHYLSLKAYVHTLQGGPVLDTSAPQSLVYANTPHGAVLAAAMYIAPAGMSTPQPGGCLTQWHVHTNLCTTSLGVVTAVVTAADSTCPAGSSNNVTPPMMHVWFVPIPGGPTAIDASDAQVVRAAELVGSGGVRNGPA